MARCAISLGGNMGDVRSAFAETARRLQASGRVSEYRQSRCYRTAPMGAEAGGAFLNAAAVFETPLRPLELLDLLQEIEQSSGRVRTIPWGPRTLDLDLLLCGEEQQDSERLMLPHPALWHRRFVLDPLVELIPDAVHPVFRRTIRELRDRLLERPLTVAYAGISTERRQGLLAGTCHPAVQWADKDEASAAIVFTGSEFPAVSPRSVRLPHDISAARQRIEDVLTAALDEPVVEE